MKFILFAVFVTLNHQCLTHPATPDDLHVALKIPGLTPLLNGILHLVLKIVETIISVLDPLLPSGVEHLKIVLDKIHSMITNLGTSHGINVITDVTELIEDVVNSVTAVLEDVDKDLAPIVNTLLGALKGILKGIRLVGPS